jgi:hypothetical protein
MATWTPLPPWWNAWRDADGLPARPRDRTSSCGPKAACFEGGIPAKDRPDASLGSETLMSGGP